MSPNGMMVKQLPTNERPREKLMNKGAKALSDAELLAILLRTGVKDQSVLYVAQQLLARYHDNPLAVLADMPVRELSSIKGIGQVKAVTVLAALELGRRLAQLPGSRRLTVRSSHDVVDYMRPRLRHELKENFIILLLNTKNHVLAEVTVSVGGLDSSLAHPREVFREAILQAAAAVILVHNHPSGDPQPSDSDVEITQRLIEAGDIIGIKVLDHIIIGDDDYVSFKERQLF